MVQKGIYEYSRARAGHYAKVLFREPEFQAAAASRTGVTRRIMSVDRLERCEDHANGNAERRPSIDPGIAFMSLDSHPIAITPYRHVSLAVGPNNCASIDDLGQFLRRKYAVVGFGDLCQIGRSELQGLCPWTIAESIDAVAWHAGNLILGDAKMLVLGPGMNSRRNLQR